MTAGADVVPRRSVDWYELFFDLVFVAVVAVSAQLVERDPGLGSVVLFVALFFPLWWAWVNLMITNNLYGTRFPAVGGLVVAAMPGVAAMAVAISGGIEQDGWLYAAGGAWTRLVLLAMWLLPHRARSISVPLWRVVTYNLVTATVWLVSVVVPEPWRYVLWGASIAAEILLLAVRSGFAHQVYRRASVAHGLERVGQFVVIVVGEAVYLGVTGLAATPSVAGGAAALSGFVVCALLARAFFRLGAPSAESGLELAQRAGSFGAMRDVIMYLPFVLVTALTLVAATIGIAVDDTGQPLSLTVRIILACGIVGFYAVNAIVGLRLGRPLRGVVRLLLPAIVLPGLVCLLTGALSAWVTLALAALALAVLDGLARGLEAGRWTSRDAAGGA